MMVAKVDSLVSRQSLKILIFIAHVLSITDGQVTSDVLRMSHPMRHGRVHLSSIETTRVD